MRPLFFTILALGLAGPAIFHAANAKIYGGCRFDSTTLAFAGSVEQQTACLLQKVKPKGSGSVPQPIPEWLKSHVGQSVDLKAGKAKKYLSSKNILETDLGGEIAFGDSGKLKYFVIHDTSFPEVTGTFPANIDDVSYVGNKLTIWGAVRNKVNLIVSRDGRSRTFNNWNALRSQAGIKIETQSRVPQSRKVFAHVENVQPRIKPPATFAWIAPDPGFSPAQEHRLALAYVVASIRAGHWLIPAYHFNIDQGLPDGHDDPQNTNLDNWVAQVSAITAEISQMAE
jgi:hypothetical protein